MAQQCIAVTVNSHFARRYVLVDLAFPLLAALGPQLLLIGLIGHTVRVVACPVNDLGFWDSALAV